MADVYHTPLASYHRQMCHCVASLQLPPALRAIVQLISNPSIAVICRPACHLIQLPVFCSGCADGNSLIAFSALIYGSYRFCQSFRIQGILGIPGYILCIISIAACLLIESSILFPFHLCTTVRAVFKHRYRVRHRFLRITLADRTNARFIHIIGCYPPPCLSLLLFPVYCFRAIPIEMFVRLAFYIRPSPTPMFLHVVLDAISTAIYLSVFPFHSSSLVRLR